jgi:hypothetical protein
VLALARLNLLALPAGNRWRSRKPRLEDERVSEAEARMRGHDAYDLIEEQFNQDLDRSLGPTGPDGLFGHVADMALPSGAVVVDVGCGEGEHAVELATRFGFQVTGVGRRLPRVPPRPEAGRPCGDLPDVRDQPAGTGGGGLPAAGHGLLGLGDAPGEQRGCDQQRCGHLLHAARLLREPERYITRFGKQNYHIKLGDCLWHVYRMIGKLSSRVYPLSAPNDFGMPGPTAESGESGG